MGFQVKFIITQYLIHSSDDLSYPDSHGLVKQPRSVKSSLLFECSSAGARRTSMGDI